MKTLLKTRLGIRCAAAVTAALLALAATNVSAATYTWTQTAGGSQNWTTGGNWDGGSAPSPGTSDTVDFSTVDIASTTLNLEANRTANIWKFGDTSGGQTWTVSGSTLTLGGTAANLDVGTATTISSILAVANGTTATATGSGALALDASTFKIGGTAAGTTQTFDLSGLSSFLYNNNSGAFSVGGQLGGNVTRTIGTLTLSADSTFTAATFGVANQSNGGNSSQTNNTNLGTLNLTGSTTVNTGVITVGANQANGVIQYVSGTANSTLKIRGTDGVSAATSMLVGQGGGNGNGYTTTSTVDLVTGVTGTSTLDALMGTLTIGHCNRGSTASGNGGTVNGTFTMGAGTLTVGEMVLGSTTTYGNTGNSQTVNGTFTTGAGGVVKATTLTIVNQINTTGYVKLNGTFNLDGGADVYATTIQPGSTTAGTVTRKFNWNDGTIHNLAGTDLTINTGVTWTLAATGTRKFDIDNGQTGTVNASLAGAGGLIKAGEGKLTLAATNSYAGDTTIEAGTLEVSGSLASDNIYVQTGLLLVSGTVGGTSLVVQSGGILGGDGVINAGALVFQSGAKLQFNPSNTLTYNGTWDVNFTDFSVASLVGLDNTVALGTYTLIDDGANDRFDLSSGVSNVGSGNAYDLGGGKYAWFEEGSLNLVVSTIPEPATLGLIGVVGVAMLLRRRIVRG